MSTSRLNLIDLEDKCGFNGCLAQVIHLFVYLFNNMLLRIGVDELTMKFILQADYILKKFMYVIIICLICLFWITNLNADKIVVHVHNYLHTLLLKYRYYEMRIF